MIFRSTYAKSWLAADYLSRNAGDAAKSTEFSRIGSDDKRNAVDYLKKTNFQHVQVIKFGSSASDCEFQRENLPPAATREQIAQHLLRTLYPTSLLQEHLGGRVAELIGKKVSQVETDYRNTLGFPMLMTHSLFQEAIGALTELGNMMGLKHPAESGGGVCGRRPRLTADQLGDAIISEPFDVTAAPSLTQPQTAATSARPSTTSPTDSSRGKRPGIHATSGQPGYGYGRHLITLPSRQQIRQEIARLRWNSRKGVVSSQSVSLSLLTNGLWKPAHYLHSFEDRLVVLQSFPASPRLSFSVFSPSRKSRRWLSGCRISRPARAESHSLCRQSSHEPSAYVETHIQTRPPLRRWSATSCHQVVAFGDRLDFCSLSANRTGGLSPILR